MLHPSLPPCRAPAQVLRAGPTKPRQQGPTATAHAGDTGHAHHTTAAGAVSRWNSCPGSCCCISHTKSSSKLKAQAWAGQSATSAQLSSEPELSMFLQGVVLRQHSCSHTLTHNLLWPTVLHQRKTSQHSIPVHPKGTDFPPPRLYFKFLKNLLLRKVRAALSLLHATALPREGGTQYHYYCPTLNLTWAKRSDSSWQFNPHQLPADWNSPRKLHAL